MANMDMSGALSLLGLGVLSPVPPPKVAERVFVRATVVEVNFIIGTIKVEVSFFVKVMKRGNINTLKR